MDELYQEQQEQENESGIDMHDCYHNHHPLETPEWADKNMAILKGFEEIFNGIRPIKSNTALTDSAKPL